MKHNISFKDGILTIDGKTIENYPMFENKGKYYIDIKQILVSLTKDANIPSIS